MICIPHDISPFSVQDHLLIEPAYGLLATTHLILKQPSGDNFDCADLTQIPTVADRYYNCYYSSDASRGMVSLNEHYCLLSLVGCLHVLWHRGRLKCMTIGLNMACQTLPPFARSHHIPIWPWYVRSIISPWYVHVSVMYDHSVYVLMETVSF